MKRSLRVDGHQPVVLEPLCDLEFVPGEPVYIGVLYDRNSVTYKGGEPQYERVEMNSWLVWTGESWLDALTYDDVNRNPCFGTSLGRVLQPGETLVCFHTG